MGDKGSLSIDMMKLHEVMPPTEDDSKGSSESRLAAAGVQSAFKKLEIKKGWCKTLAKPMLHYRLLNCRASGLLEQSDPPKSRIGRFPMDSFLAATSVIAVDYEVLGLQVTVATIFGNCFGAYIFCFVVF